MSLDDLPRYAVRNSLLDKKREFTLEGDALVYTQGGQRKAIEYSSVKFLRLFSYAGSGIEVFQCTLVTNAGKKLKIRSADFISLGRFEDQRSSYRPFIVALVKRIGDRAPGAAFIAGSTGLLFLWLIVGLLFAAVLLAIVLSLFEGISPAVSGIIFLGFAVASVPLLLRELRKGRAKSFDPNAPPEDLIGG